MRAAENVVGRTAKAVLLLAICGALVVLTVWFLGLIDFRPARGNFVSWFTQLVLGMLALAPAGVGLVCLSTAWSVLTDSRYSPTPPSSSTAQFVEDLVSGDDKFTLAASEAWRGKSDEIGEARQAYKEQIEELRDKVSRAVSFVRNSGVGDAAVSISKHFRYLSTQSDWQNWRASVNIENIDVSSPDDLGWRLSGIDFRLKLTRFFDQRDMSSNYGELTVSANGAQVLKLATVHGEFPRWSWESVSLLTPGEWMVPLVEFAAALELFEAKLNGASTLRYWQERADGIQLPGDE
jgi:hypothetical protein